jgi:hypothetical protein
VVRGLCLHQAFDQGMEKSSITGGEESPTLPVSWALPLQPGPGQEFLRVLDMVVGLVLVLTEKSQCPGKL